MTIHQNTNSHQNTTSIQTSRCHECHVGIDVCKDRLDLCLLYDDNATAPFHRQFSNCANGWQVIIDLLSGHPVVCITLEATGGYERCS